MTKIYPLYRQLCVAAVAVLTGTTVGCTSVPSAQLVDARLAYAEASQSNAVDVAPTELYDSKKALDRANKEYAEQGDSPESRDYAYIATRKVQLTGVRARMELDRRLIAEAVKAGVVVRDNQVKDSRAALASSREELKEERRSTEAQGKELETEKKARLVAETMLAGAMRDLAAVAAVREDARGVVITLSGSILFASNKFALLNTAMTKLDQVAIALKAQDADKRMVVEGHTDSQGSDQTNQPLSLNRAKSVRDYLVSKGVVAERITSVGLGSKQPLVDNNTPENRANNRRVEIIISPSNKVSSR